MATFTKALIAKEDVQFDTDGVDATNLTPTSTGGTRQVHKINASHVPTKADVRVHSATAVDVNTALHELFTALANYLLLAGGTMSGAIAMGSNKITGLANGTASGDALHMGQADASTIEVSGGVLRVKSAGITSTQLAALLTSAAITDLMTSRLEFDLQTSNPSTAAGEYKVFIKNDGSADQLYLRHPSDGTITKITNQNATFAAADYTSAWTTIGNNASATFNHALSLGTIDQYGHIEVFIRESATRTNEYLVYPNGGNTTTGFSVAIVDGDNIAISTGTTYVVSMPGITTGVAPAWSAKNIASADFKVKIWKHA